MGEDRIGSGASERAREAFFVATQGPFEEFVGALSDGAAFAPKEWVGQLRRAALPIFDREVLPGLSEVGETRRQKAIAARSKLTFAFSGRPPYGKKIFDPLDLEVPQRRTKQGGRA